MKKTHKVLFTISIILNLALMGVIGGHAMKRAQDMPWFELKDKLSPQTQELMKNMFEGKKDVIFKNWQTLKEKKKKLEEVITAEQFDENAFDAAMQDWQAFNSQVTEGKKLSFKVLLKQLPQEERIKLAEHLVQVLLGTKERGKGRKVEMKKRFEEWRSGQKNHPEVDGDGENLANKKTESK